MNPLHLLRMRRWVQRPPSVSRVIVVVVAILLCAVIWGIDQLGWWPEWATADRHRRGVPLR